MTIEDFRQLCHDRRSIRYFDNRPVTKEEIRTLLSIAILSPSVENTQPWHFHVILERSKREQITEVSCYGNFITGAGAFIVITCNRLAKPMTKDIIWNPKELEYSCASAMSFAMLGAQCMNLGTCWVSLHHGKAHEMLALPNHEIVIGGLMVGHMKDAETTASVPHERISIDAVCTYYE